MPGHYLEEFTPGQIFRHPLRRTITEGDSTLIVQGGTRLTSADDIAALPLLGGRGPVTLPDGTVVEPELTTIGDVAEVEVADEPVTALDVCVREQVLDLILDLRAEFGMAVLLVTHDLGVVADACDRTVVAYAGQIVETGGSDALFAGPRHPYTHSLLGARPVALSTEPLMTIPGAVPAPGQWPRGCRFVPRCVHARPDCSAAPVEITAVDPGHAARCLRLEEAPWL